MNLGDLTQALDNFPDDYHVSFNMLNWGAPPGTPTKIKPWKDFTHLTFDFSQVSTHPVSTVGQLVAECRRVLDQPYQIGSTKGRWTRETPVWIGREPVAIVKIHRDDTIPNHVCMDTLNIKEYIDAC